ncbi:Dynein regulatory complex protein 1 homolog [Gryllus bimaculatus]|nr:Dynein regulatory complex protein 1 homolog [Gryllus bimaculatus]
MDTAESEQEEEEPRKKDPQVTSTDPIERKLARRLRIQKRLEQVKKTRDGREVSEEGEESIKTPIEQQIADSMVTLDHLIQDGQEQVTNIRVANDAREVKRRQEQAEARIVRMKLVEDEARESLEKLEEINQKWREISNYRDPLDIYSDMEKQKVKCEELLQAKNEVIEKLNKELDKNDEFFRRDQKRQKEDLNLLAERIDNHINMMSKAYRQELAMLDEVIKVEQSELVESTNKEWEELYKERDKEEVVNMKKKFELIIDFEKEMDTIHVEHQEKYREAKMRLEADIRVLQQELEKIKALCLLNSEKLDYNFLILKKRDAENIIMKAHQKRRINKLQDVVNKLRARIEEAERTTKAEKQRLTDEVLKLHNNIIDIGRKADQFAEVNDKKYNQVWEMNENIAKDLLEKILTADRVIHEQQLGLPWQPPDLSIMTKSELPSFSSAMQAVDKLFKDKEELNAIRSKGNLLRHILHKIADSSGFLVEEKIFPLLFPYRKTEKTLVKIENIFKALGIQTEEDIQMLKEYFIPKSSSEEKDEVDLFTSLNRGMTHTLSKLSAAAAAAKDEDDQGSVASDAKSMSEGSATATLPDSVRDTKIDISAIKELGDVPKPDHCDPSHPLKIDPIYVLKALRAFVTDFSKSKEIVVETLSDRLAKERRTVSRSLKTEDVTAYWTRFTQIFSPEKEKLWDALLIGLHKYLEILQARHKLNEEVHSLRQQNDELKRLLQQYVMTFDSLNMSETVVSVCWKDHTSELSTVYKSLLENNVLVDCTISAEGQTLKAHRLILSACSPYFHMLFREETGKHTFVILLDASFETLKAMIDFVYRGEAQIPEGNLEAFLTLAQSLQIKGLNGITQHYSKNRSSSLTGNASHSALCEDVQLASLMTPLQEHHKPQCDEVSEDPEITVKHEPLHALSTETRSEKLDNVKVVEGTTKNFMSEMEGSEENLNLFSKPLKKEHENFNESFHGNVDLSVMQTSQEQQMQLNFEVSSGQNVAETNDPLQFAILVPKIEHLDDKDRDELVDDSDLSGNGANETGDATEACYGEQNPDQLSSE